MTFLLGIDGGGTNSRAALATPDGEIIGRGAGGPSNIRTDLEGARQSIITAATLALADAGLGPDMFAQTRAVLGLAGTNAGPYAAQLAEHLPFAESRIVSDAVIALEGAVGEGDGAMAILGTGSIFTSRSNGQFRSIGGWGFQIGDQGSGARIGRDLLEETMLAYDGIVPASPLTGAVLALYHDTPSELIEFTRSAVPADYGRFAPLVFDHVQKGDPTALRIVERARHMIEASLDALDLSPGAPVCLLGGMAQFFAPRLSPRFQAVLRPPLQDAVGGAVSMAARLFADRETENG